MIDELNFTSNKDAIGFDWKEYNFDAGFYSVKSNLNYIIKDRQQRYFKLRFTDFYNSNEIKDTQIEIKSYSSYFIFYKYFFPFKINPISCILIEFICLPFK